MQNYEWYSQLIKPSFSPPAWVFSPVWSFLYALILISFGYVFYLYFKKRKIKFLTALPFFLNLVFNFAFTPLMFGLQNLWLAALDVVLVLATLIWGILVIYKKVKWVAYLQIPYLLWVSFATFLQLTITYLNWNSGI